MVHVMHMLLTFLAVFKTLKCSEDNNITICQYMPQDVFIENATQMVRIILLNTKNEDQTLR